MNGLFASKGIKVRSVYGTTKECEKGWKVVEVEEAIYGLNDASRKFWLKVKEVFAE